MTGRSAGAEIEEDKLHKSSRYEDVRLLKEHHFYYLHALQASRFFTESKKNILQPNIKHNLLFFNVKKHCCK